MPVEHILDTECSSQNITDRPSAFLAVLFIQSGTQFKQQRLPDAGWHEGDSLGRTSVMAWNVRVKWRTEGICDLGWLWEPVSVLPDGDLTFRVEFNPLRCGGQTVLCLYFALIALWFDLKTIFGVTSTPHLPELVYLLRIAQRTSATMLACLPLVSTSHIIFFTSVSL